MNSNPLLDVKQLSVSLPTAQEVIHAVDGLTFSIQRGQTFALVGESGCGKSITAHALVRLLPQQAILYQGSEIHLDDYDLLSFTEKDMRMVRRQKIGMIFQDPMASLNPILTIGEQLREARLKGRQDLPSYWTDMLHSVRIPDPERVLKEYPHQLSGGMKQRIMIAMALAKEPDLLIADEPTTALDVTTQAQVLAILKDLQQQKNMTILLITHDLGVVAQMADWVAVMYAGYIVEQAKAKDFFTHPKHPYSQKLLAALPDESDRERPLAVIPGTVPQRVRRDPLCRFRDRCHNANTTCAQQPPLNALVPGYGDVRCHGYDLTLLDEQRPNIQLPEPEPFEEPFVSNDLKPVLQVEDLKVYYPIRKGFFKRVVGHVKAVDGISFELNPGKTLALVGESGCGKTTAGKALLQLIPVTSGRVVYWGKNIQGMPERSLRRVRGDLQLVFQDPFSSMDPKMNVAQILEEGMLALNIGSHKGERQERIDSLLDQVGLRSSMKYRFPHEFSGGQRQRIAIARALAVNPKLIICDEPTSALDVSVQAQILNLLERLQIEYEISFLFITHNISVVRYIADRVAVMYLGRIVEEGSVDEVLEHPKHPYTQALLAAVPSVKGQLKFAALPKGEVPSSSNPPKGCHYHPRCPHAMAVCSEKYPESYGRGSSHQVKCYLYADSTSEVVKDKETIQGCESQAQ